MTWQVSPWQDDVNNIFEPVWGYSGSLIPSLDLNFAAMAVNNLLDPRITYSGASLATLTDATGKIAYKPHNLLTYSEQFDGAGWYQAALTVSANSVAAPTGAVTADTVNFTAAVNSRITQAYTTVAATYQFLCWVRADAPCTVAFGDILTTEVTINVTTSWQQFTFTRALSASTHTFGFKNGENVVKAIHVWGAQLNVGPLQPYYPTTSSAYFGPRFTYDPITHAALGLLIEEQRTNALLWSDDISNAWWTKTGATAVGGNEDQYGGLSWFKLTEDGSTGEHKFGRAAAVSCTSGVVHTISFCVKPSGRTRIRLYIYGFNNYTPFIDLSTKSVVSATGGTSPTVKLTDASNGFIRVEITDTTSATELQIDGLILVSTGTTFSYAGDGSSGVVIGGIQREAGAFATSYIPTTSASVTRAADSATMTGANFSSWFNAAQGTFVWEGRTSLAVSDVFSVTDGTLQNAVASYASGGDFIEWVNSAWSVQAINSTGAGITAGTPVKMALTYAANDFRSCVNGGAVASDAAGTVPTGLTRLALSGSDEVLISGKKNSAPIARLRYYNTALTNAQLQALTT